MSHHCKTCNYMASSSSNYFKHCKTNLHKRMKQKEYDDAKIQLENTNLHSSVMPEQATCTPEKKLTYRAITVE